MRFKLWHPGFRSCDDCQKWIYDPKTGEQLDRPAGSGVPIPRPPGNEPPCYCCPKLAGCEERNPAVGRRQELSERNLRTWALYQRIHGARLSGDGLDDTTIDNLGVIHDLVTGHARAQAEG